MMCMPWHRRYDIIACILVFLDRQAPLLLEMPVSMQINVTEAHKDFKGHNILQTGM